MIGRIFRVVRTPITLLILFGVLLYGAWWGYNNIIKPVPALPPDDAPPSLAARDANPHPEAKHSTMATRI